MTGHQPPSPIVDEMAVKRPCPKCGVDDSEMSAQQGWYFVECQNCDRITKAWRTPAEAIADWNGAALVSPPKAGAGEPVAWRWRYDDPSYPGKMLGWFFGPLKPPPKAVGRSWPGWECEPLYANHEARGDGVRVKPLEWETDQVGGGLRAGEYRVRAGLWTHGYYWLRGEDDPHTGYAEEDDAKEAAQLDHETRIRSALLPPLGDGRAENEFAEYEGVTAKELATTVARYGKALRKIADLRVAEDANEPFDEALDLADAALSNPGGGL